MNSLHFCSEYFDVPNINALLAVFFLLQIRERKYTKNLIHFLWLKNEINSDTIYLFFNDIQDKMTKMNQIRK